MSSDNKKARKGSWTGIRAGDWTHQKNQGGVL